MLNFLASIFSTILNMQFVIKIAYIFRIFSLIISDRFLNRRDCVQLRIFNAFKMLSYFTSSFIQIYLALFLYLSCIC